jgi:HK97 family phage portal protein
MTLRSRVGAAWSALLKDAGGGEDLARMYGSLAPFIEVYGSRASKSGAVVNWQTALQVATVLACVRVLADGVAQVPLKLYRERADKRGSDAGERSAALQRALSPPNPWQTSYEFRETMMLHTVLCGNFYAFKNRVGPEIRELIPLEPGRVEVEQNKDYSLVYYVRNEAGERREFPQEMILHVRGPSWNSWMGMEAVKLARESIGLSMAIEADQAQLYANGLRTSGVYSVEGKLNDKQYRTCASGSTNTPPNPAAR